MTKDDYQLSAHLKLSEASVSASHPDLCEPLPDELLPTAIRLAETGFEPIRLWLKKRLKVLSWFRPKALNKAVGGSPTSQHTVAEAMDITPEDGSAIRAVFEAILKREIVLPLGQVIWYPSRNFLHIALPSRRFPKLTLCIHEPSKGLKYEVIESIKEYNHVMAE